GWLERMFKYKKNMKDFTGDMLEVIVEPELKYGKKESVQLEQRAIPIFEILHPGC
ncbi:18057_t:CDS:2, partial [Gigaspora rosea]